MLRDLSERIELEHLQNALAKATPILYKALTKIIEPENFENY